VKAGYFIIVLALCSLLIILVYQDNEHRKKRHALCENTYTAPSDIKACVQGYGKVK